MIKAYINSIDFFTLANDHLLVSIAPAMGGKITSVFNKLLDKEFLWTNTDMQPTIHHPGSDYDSNFFGGIDELIPNDIPEKIDGIDYPDHGELWTTKLAYETTPDKIKVYGLLPLSGLHYSKTLSLEPAEPVLRLDYIITNNSGSQRNFLWKLHAALPIQEGDRVISHARQAKVADPAYSRFKNEPEPFQWPQIEHTDASVVPARNGSVDFFYLFDIPEGDMQLLSQKGQFFSIRYDTKVFPYEWLFASYGGFSDHYTAILEPCTSMPISVNDAEVLGQCTMLAPGESLTTSVTIFAGKK